MKQPEVEYVWEVPVRVVHWVIVIAVVVLSITGAYIGVPYVQIKSVRLMMWMRAIHFFSGYVLTICLGVRLIWYVVGNKYADWRTVLPLTKKQRRDFWGAVRYYLFLQREYPRELGHTYLATVAYFVVFMMILVQCVTGFALMFDDGGSGMLSWMMYLYGGPLVTRLIHHGIMWLMICFVIFHVYSAVLIDNDERNGLISSMFTGYKTKL